MMLTSVPLLILVATVEPGGTAGDAARTADRPARVLFERAEAKFDLGSFEAALADYQAAYELEPLPGFLFNIGQCHRNLGNYERARFFYRRYLNADPRTPNRRQTEKLIAEMSKRLDEQQAGSHEQGAEVPVALLPAAAGSTAPNQPPSAPVGSAPAVHLTDSRADRPAEKPRFYRRPWFWAGVGGALAAGVVASILLTRDDPRGSLPSIDAR